VVEVERDIELQGKVLIKMIILNQDKVKRLLLLQLGAQVGGPHEKKTIFQIASGPILSISTHSNSSQYDPCSFVEKK
jgi:hypothetical protein